jgi:hypothetical protein
VIIAAASRLASDISTANQSAGNRDKGLRQKLFAHDAGQAGKQLVSRLANRFGQFQL